MGLLFYHIKIECHNCGYKNQLSVRKGNSIKEFLESSACKCKECGCKIEPTKDKNGNSGYNYETQWIK